ncbi:MAG TPA: hypothetical protein PL105_26470, partial [Caldilineaceae bacterium]|nr:hypothetical protein [Caldilineaceae bacterium]
RVEQTLLPPHHVFVHLRDSSGHLLAQDDAPPGRGLAPAPSNTWQPGEYISDPHRLSSPAARSGLLAQVGLYAPSSGLRLPVNVNGEIVGDTFPIPME